MNLQPFSWELVPSISSAQARLERRARNFFAHQKSDAMLARLNDIVRAPVDVRMESVKLASPMPRGGSIAIALEHEHVRVVVLVDAGLASLAVMRTMKREPPRVIDPTRVGSVALAGAFAAILVAASRAGNAPLRVTWCGDASDLSEAKLPPRIADVHALAIVDDDAFETHLYVPEQFFDTSPNPLFSRSDLIALDSLPIALNVIASAATCSLREIESLSLGDVWLPDSFLTRAMSGNFFGDVVLASPTSDRGIRARLTDDESLVLVEGAEEMAMTGEENAIVGNAGDAPIVVRVEVGAVTLSAREWSALKAGDVITTQHQISDPVILRVSGVEVARGELVNVDGQIGVRIASRS